MDDSIYIASNGKYAINPAVSFVNVFKEKPLSYKGKISDHLQSIRNYVLNEAGRIGVTLSEGAFNKCNGDWYEWLIAIRAIEFFIENKTSKLLVSLPNKSSFDVITLYENELRYYIFDLAYKLGVRNVNLITSNPDFVILNLDCVDKYLLLLRDVSFSNLDVQMLSFVDEIYKNFIGYANIDSIHGYLSVKTTFRPDRRLQLAHEGSLMKAIYTHLQTRTWTISNKSIRYYGGATFVGRADIEALRTVATHSITDVKSLPQSAVDDVFRINSFFELDQCLSSILV